MGDGFAKREKMNCVKDRRQHREQSKTTECYKSG